MTIYGCSREDIVKALLRTRNKSKLINMKINMNDIAKSKKLEMYIKCLECLGLKINIHKESENK
jgi:hypothetical protein